MATTHHSRTASRHDYSTRIATLFGVFTFVAILGWFVSTLLTAIHIFALPAIPPTAPVQGSIEVITSPWAYVFGIPLATIGAVYYLTTIGLALWWFDTRHPFVMKILAPITVTGVIASGYFVWLQLGPIGAICPFCMLSATATVILLGLEVAMIRYSSTPTFREMLTDFVPLIRETDFAVVLFPILIGMVTLLGMFLIPLLPLPDPVPFA